RAEEVAEHVREHVVVGAGALSAHGERHREHVVPAFELGGVPGYAHGRLVADAADPGVAPRIELAGIRTEQWLHRYAAANHTERGAVLRRDVVEEVGEPQASGTGHVLRHDGWIARDVLADVAGKEAPAEVVVAADGVADQQLDGLAAVKVGHRLRRADW